MPLTSLEDSITFLGEAEEVERFKILLATVVASGSKKLMAINIIFVPTLDTVFGFPVKTF